MSVPYYILIQSILFSPITVWSCAKFHSAGISPSVIIRFTRSVLKSNPASSAAFQFLTLNPISLQPFFSSSCWLTFWPCPFPLKRGATPTISAWNKLFLSHAKSMFKSFLWLLQPVFYLHYWLPTHFPFLDPPLYGGSYKITVVCLCVCLSVCQSVFLCVYLPACLPVCLSVSSAFSSEMAH